MSVKSLEPKGKCWEKAGILPGHRESYTTLILLLLSVCVHIPRGWKWASDPLPLKLEVILSCLT